MSPTCTTNASSFVFSAAIKVANCCSSTLLYGISPMSANWKASACAFAAFVADARSAKVMIVPINRFMKFPPAESGGARPDVFVTVTITACCAPPFGPGDARDTIPAPDMRRLRSFDDLAGASKERGRNGETQLSCGSQVYDQLESGWLLHGKVGWLRTLEDFVHVASGISEMVGEIRPIRHQPLGAHKTPLSINRRQPLP